MALERPGASAPADSNGTGTRTTASFTAPANSAIVAFVTSDGDTTSGIPTYTVTGGGLTWSLAKRQQARFGGCEIWTAFSSAGGSMTVTATPSTGTYETCLHVEVLTGAESTWAGATAGASLNGGLASASLTTTRDGSWVMACSSDWAEKGAGTAGTGQTMTSEYNAAGFISCHNWRQTSTTATSGTSVTLNLTAPAAQDFNCAVIEIREAVAAAPVAPRPLVVAQPTFF